MHADAPLRLRFDGFELDEGNVSRTAATISASIVTRLRAAEHAGKAAGNSATATAVPDAR